jgi:hypothetical protein
MRGSRPGERRGGRQKGTPNKKTAENLTALDVMLAVMRDPRVSLHRLRANLHQEDISVCQPVYGSLRRQIDSSVDAFAHGLRDLLVGRPPIPPFGVFRLS